MNNEISDSIDTTSKEWEIAPESFLDFLNSNSDERSALKYFGDYPWPIFWTLCTSGGHSNYMLKEFRLGNRYVCDFAIVNCFSGVWEIKFIELEPIGDKLFNQAGSYAKRLNGAIAQISDWKAHYERNKSSVIEDLCSWMMTKDILGYHEGMENPCNSSGNYFRDHQTYVSTNYYIVIGRSSQMSCQENTRKARASNDLSIEIMTYDRFLPVVKRRYPLEKHYIYNDIN